MGDIANQRKLYNRPKKLFDKTRIEEENKIKKKYGLKNKREIWKAKTAVSKLRRRAKNLIGKDMNKQQEFFKKLNKQGISVTKTADVLALNETDLLERRLQTFLVKKKLCNTPKGARQLITHKKVLVKGNVVNKPSYHITKELENEITIKEQAIKPTKEMKEQKEEAEEKPKEETA
jgi:small subunit ribosomal protein S4